jgi:hypothetical protein
MQTTMRKWSKSCDFFGWFWTASLATASAIRPWMMIEKR